MNARSLLPKLSEIKLIAQKSKAAVISVTETWLDDSVCDGEIAIDNYSVVRRDRNRNGGGVCVYVRQDFAFAVRRDLLSSNEFLFIDLLLPKTKPIIIGTIYRPPKQCNFLEQFEEALTYLRSDCEIVILGDFNICCLQLSSSILKGYQNVLKLFNLEQIINEPTRVTNTNSSLLDHIVCNNREKIFQSGVIPVGLSDHSLIFCSRKTMRIPINKHNLVRMRSMKHYNKDDFVTRLLNAKWDDCFKAENVTVAWQSFRDIFMSVLDSIAPIKEIRLKNRTEPWMTSDILEDIKQRDFYLYRFKKNRAQEDYKLFCKLRNKVQRNIRTAKSEYLSNKIEENKNEPKNLWQQLKNLGYKNSKKDSSNVVLTINDENCHDSKTVSDYFNQFFTNIASTLVQKLPFSKKKFDLNSDLLKKFYDKRNPHENKFYLKTVSEDFVYKELCNLKIGKSTGLDGIPARFLRDGAEVLKIPVTFIINMSISEKTVPSDLKLAKVKPLYKKNSSLEVGNYRPVSILSIVSKILEKAVYTQFEAFLINNNLLYEFQSGFRSLYSTDTCLIHLQDHIKMKSSKGLFTGMVMLDLQKAFDTVDHDILCGKLKIMGVESIEWFRSYLSNRKQLVYINDTYSEPANIVCGVPQGSILGPLLFLCYVNDMSISIDEEAKLILYADDSAILYSHQNPDFISKKLGSILESCSSWLVDNKLSLHLGKTECILFGSKRKVKKVENFQVTCNDHTIVSSKQVKYLGLSIDCTLSGEAIVHSIVNKVNARLKFLYRHSGCLSLKCRQLLCSALIQCHFDYCSTSWYAGLGKGLKKKLQITQNKVVRFILQMGPRSRIDPDILSGLNMLDVENRVKQLRLGHVHKVFYGKCPSYMADNFVRVSNFHCHNTRSCEYNFIVPQCGKFGNGTFCFNAIKDWNALPDNIKMIQNTNRYKMAVKLYLQNQCKLKVLDTFIYNSSTKF